MAGGGGGGCEGKGYIPGHRVVNRADEIISIQHVATIGARHEHRGVLELLQLATETCVFRIHDDVNQGDCGTCVGGSLGNPLVKSKRQRGHSWSYLVGKPEMVGTLLAVLGRLFTFTIFVEENKAMYRFSVMTRISFEVQERYHRYMGVLRKLV